MCIKAGAVAPAFFLCRSAWGGTCWHRGVAGDFSDARSALDRHSGAAGGNPDGCRTMSGGLKGIFHGVFWPEREKRRHLFFYKNVNLEKIFYKNSC